MKNMTLRKMTGTAAISLLVAAAAQAQFTGGKLVVLRAGDNGPGQNESTNASDIAGAHQAPAFIDEYDPAVPISISSTNTGTNGPIFSVAIPTNDPTPGVYNSMWFNGHAGTEGYLAQSLDLGSVAWSGYGGDILAVSGTPSGLNIPRGISVIDVSGNTTIAYEGGNWYGLGAGTQTNPRGCVSDNGTNNFFGSGSEDGNEWYQLGNNATPESIQNFASTRSVRFINNFFYNSLQAGDGGSEYPPGIYNYAPPTIYGGLGTPVALPEGNAYFLNLVVPASPSYPNVEAYDISPQGNVCYMADNTYGIAKYQEIGGTWQLLCAFGVTNNTSTGPLVYPSSYTGFFGLVVDWTSASYPIVYGTTTEGNGGYANSNRLIRLDDNYNFTDGQLHTNITTTTLATGWSGNIVFKGLAWAPDRRPQITSQPANQSVVTGSAASFTVGVSTLFPNTYYWYVNGTLDPSQTTATYSVASATANGTYQVMVSNLFGTVTSTVATLTVTASPTAPSLTSPVPALNLTNAVNDMITIPTAASGTTPLSYAWWFSSGPGNTGQIGDGGDYTGSVTGTLSISISSTSDAGSYYLVMNNSTGTPSSNLVATLNVVTPLPVIFQEPVNTVAASNGQAQFYIQAYPLSATYQWYQGNTPLSDNGHWSGSANTNLTDLNVQGSDATTYYCVVSDTGGSVTSSVVTITVETPAPFSVFPYTSLGQIYTQNFDSLPDPGTVSVNNSTTSPTSPMPATIDGITYEVSNPFDFAGAIGVEGVGDGFGGLGLSNTMVGWYSSDSGAEQIQATSGDNTTGLIVSFGCTNAVNTVNPLYPTNNRALGIIASPATYGNGLFAFRLVNLTGQTLTNFNLSYVSELWRDTQTTNIVTNWFYVDQFGTNSTPTNNWTGGLTNLLFTTNAPGFSKGAKIYGTNAPLLTTNMAFVNVPTVTPWTPGAILWIVWEEVTIQSGAQGIGIDNLVFSTGIQPSLNVQQAGSSAVVSWPAMFAGYTLQQNSNLNNPNGWVNVGIMPTAFEGMNFVTNSVGPTQMFYRLKN